VVVIADPGHPSYRQLLLDALAGYRVELLPWSEARVRLYSAIEEMGLIRRA
jgi:ATP-dependent DNA helicase DinG